MQKAAERLPSFLRLSMNLPNLIRSDYRLACLSQGKKKPAYLKP